MNSPEHPTLPNIDTLWNYADPVASEAAFQRILPQAVSDALRDYRGQLLTQIARCQILQRRYAEGHATLDEVEQQLSPVTPVARVRYLLERGRAWNDQSRFAEASALFEQAFHLAMGIQNDTLAVDAAHMLGLLPPPENAVRWNERALAIARHSDEPPAQRWVGNLNLNLGVRYQMLAQYDPAQQAFEAALTAFTQHDNRQRMRLARLCLAKNLRLRQQYEAALALDQALLIEMKQAGEPLGYAYEEIAECLLALDRQAEARPYFALAYETLRAYAWYPPHEVERLARLQRLSQSLPTS